MPKKKLPRTRIYNSVSSLRDTGFTLIEVMVAIAIIALVGAVALPNIRTFSSVQEINIVSVQIADNLRKAQSSASSRIKCPEGDESTDSWRVDITGTSQSLIAKCKTLLDKTVNTFPYKASSGGNTFQVVTDRCTNETTSIYFTGSQMSYKCASTAQVVGVVTITLSGSGLTEKVIIEPGGTIRSE